VLNWLKEPDLQYEESSGHATGVPAYIFNQQKPAVSLPRAPFQFPYSNRITGEKTWL